MNPCALTAKSLANEIRAYQIKKELSIFSFACNIFRKVFYHAFSENQTVDLISILYYIPVLYIYLGVV